MAPDVAPRSRKHSTSPALAPTGSFVVVESRQPICLCRCSYALLSRRVALALVVMSILLSVNSFLVLIQQGTDAPSLPDHSEHSQLSGHLRNHRTGTKRRRTLIKKYVKEADRRLNEADRPNIVDRHLNDFEDSYIPRAGQPEIMDVAWRSKTDPLQIIGHFTPQKKSHLKITSSTRAEDILERTAIAVKTFDRPECCLRTIRSFRNQYPSIAIFVADDSHEDLLSETLVGELNVVYVRLPVDAGVGYGRNRLVDTVKRTGYQFLLMSDDDYTMDQPSLLERMAEHYVATKADVLGAVRCDYGHCDRNLGSFHITEARDLIILPNATVYPPEAIPTCVRTELVQQFFLAQTTTLAKHGWDDLLKNNDHYDFLLTAKSAELKLVSCTDTRVIHEKQRCQKESGRSEEYAKVRSRRWLALVEYMFQKWNLRSMYDETGKRIMGHSISDSSKLFSTNRQPLIIPSKIKSVCRKTRLLYQFLAGGITSQLARQEGSKALSLKPATCISYRMVNPCTFYIIFDESVTSGIRQGKRQLKYKGHGNSEDFYQFNRTCADAEAFWSLSAHGEAKVGNLYLMLSVQSEQQVEELIANLSNQTGWFKMSLVIAGVGVSTARIQKAIRQCKDSKSTSMLCKTHVYFTSMPGETTPDQVFTKTLNFSKEVSSERGHTDCVGLFVADHSMILREIYIGMMRRRIQCGVSSLQVFCSTKAHGLSTSVAGVCLSDYTPGNERADFLNHGLPFDVRLDGTGSCNSSVYPISHFKSKLISSRPSVGQKSTVMEPGAGLFERLAKFAAQKLAGSSSLLLDMTVLELFHNPGASGVSPMWYILLKDKSSSKVYFALIKSPM